MRPSLDTPTSATSATLPRLRGLILAALVLLLSGCYSRDLSGPEILALLTDSTVTGRHMVRSYQFERQYRRDGTFTQQAGPGFPTAGKWSVRGDRVIIQWKNDRRSLSRKVRTDDKGRYWKVIPGKGKVVVEYDAFVGPDGVDRRVVKSLPSRSLYWLFSWRSLLLAFALWLVWGVVKGDEDDPDSLGNRLWLSWRPIKAGGLARKAADIPSLRPAELDAFLAACAEHDQVIGRKLCLRTLLRQPVDEAKRWQRLTDALDTVEDDKALPVFLDAFPTLKSGLSSQQVDALLALTARSGRSFEIWKILPALEDQTTDPAQRWRRLWGIAEPLDDGAASELLEAAVGSWDAAASDPAGHDCFRTRPRACLLLSRIFERRCKSAATESTFDDAKSRGLLYAGAAREHMKIQKDASGEATSADPAADATLVADIVAAYEALMFATYTPPARTTPGNRSSSYVGSA